MSAKRFDSAYPGSMFDRQNGDYVLYDDPASLAAAMLDAIKRRDDELEDRRAEYHELAEAAKVAWRAICDAEAVINTIDGECSLESIKVAELQERLGACAGVLFCLLRLPTSELTRSVS